MDVISVSIRSHQPQDIIRWLCNNVQENSQPNMRPFRSSSVAQYAEWHSQDHEAWKIKISGNSARMQVWIKDEKLKVIFALKFS